MGKQQGLCAHCAEQLDDTAELDHIIRVADLGGNDIDNLQYLCKSCHDDKCELEELTNEIPNNKSWESTFSGDSCEGYVGSEKPQNLIFGDGTACRQAMDNVSSRLNGVIEPPWDFPKFHILDTIEAYEEQENMKGVQVYVDAGPGNVKDEVDFINYQKPIWYPYERALFMLQNDVHSDYGPITKDNFKLMFVPSTTVSRDDIIQIFDYIKTELDIAMNNLGFEEKKQTMNNKFSFSDDRFLGYST